MRSRPAFLRAAIAAGASILAWSGADRTVSAAETVLKAAQVPAAVLRAVTHKYPGAKLTGYESEVEKGQILYEVKVQQGARRIEVKLSPEGNIRVEEELISAGDLPQQVRSALSASRYGKLKIKQVERVVNDEDLAHPDFEVEVVDGRQNVELVFNGRGQLLKTEVEDPRQPG